MISKPPTIPFGIVVYSFSDNLSRNSCILKQWIVFFARSDWLLNQWISCTIHWFTSSSSERATPNSRKLRTKWLPVVCCVTNRNLTNNQTSCSRNTRRRWRNSTWKFEPIKPVKKFFCLQIQELIRICKQKKLRGSVNFHGQQPTRRWISVIYIALNVQKLYTVLSQSEWS